MSDSDLKDKETAIDPGAFENEFGSDFTDDEKTKLDELNDQVGKGFTGEGKKTVKAKSKHKNKIIAAIAGIGVSGSIISVFLFGPILKLESFMANINQRAFGYAAGAVEARASHLFEKYMISHVLDLESCGNNITASCRAPTGAGLAGALFINWRDVKIEQKLFDEYGLNIESNKNPDPSNGIHRVEITDRFGRQINLSQADVNSGRFTGGNREFGRDMRKFLKKETKWYQVMERKSVRKYLARKHGINSWCFMACAGRDNVDNRISSAKTRLKYKFVERFVYPFSGKYGLLLDCITKGTTGGACSNDGFRQRSPDRINLPDDEIDDIVRRFDGGASTTLSKYIIEKIVTRVFSQTAARTAVSAIPIAGQIYLAVSIARMVDNLDTFIDDNGLSKYAAEINSSQYAEYYTGMRSSADEIKSGAMNLDEVGAVIGEFDGAEQSRVYQSEFKSSTSTASLFGMKAYAATDPYECLNGNPIPDGELVCNEKKVARSYAVEDIRDNAALDASINILNTYGRCTGGEVAGRCIGVRPSTVLNPVIEAIDAAAGFIVGPFVDGLMVVARNTPGVNSAIDAITGLVGDMIGWLFGKVFPLPVRVDSPGREKVDGLFAGSEVVARGFGQGGYEDDASYGLGGVKLSPEQAAAIQADQLEQVAYDKKDYNLFEKMTDLENKNSLASSVIYNIPNSPDSALNQVALMFTNIFSYFGQIFNLFVPNNAHAALAPGESAFGITRYGYPVNDANLTVDPDQLTPEYCGRAKAAWEASKTEDPVTGFDEYSVANPCLLEEAAIEAAGAYFTNN